MRIQYSIFDTLLEPVFVLDAEQKVVYCNEAAAIIAGLSIRKITRGMKFPELFNFSEPIDGLADIGQVTDPTPYKEVTFKSSQGEEGKVQITLQPILDAAGGTNWIVFVRDVTLEERLQKKYRAELEQKEGVIKALEDAKAQLENYSKNLEQMVAERTRELSRLNQTMSALLDSLGQGFFIFNQEGKILDVSSKACESTIECRPDGKMIWDVLKIPGNKVVGFQKWMQTVFMEMLPFEDLAPLGPTTLQHSGSRHIAIEYHPLRSHGGTIEGVVVVASDITSLTEAQHQAEYEKEHAKLIINLIKSKREVLRFISESTEILTEIKAQTSQESIPLDVETLFRNLHTLKGGAALFSVKEVASYCHEAETVLSEFVENGSPQTNSRLRSKCRDVENAFAQFIDETKEILGLASLNQERQVEVTISKINDVANRIAGLPGGGSVAEHLVQELMMEPLTDFLEPYGDVIQNLSQRLGKVVAPLKINASEVKIVPEIYTPLISTLVHAIRNAVDHGIESSQVRQQAGKPPEGSIVVSAQISRTQACPSLLMRIQDDGGGICPVKIRENLMRRGLSTAHESDQQVIQHVFDSQFSTRDQVTEVSGRGVGMDAIKVAAESLGGQVWVESSLGQGTTLCIEVPYLTELKRSVSGNRSAA